MALENALASIECGIAKNVWKKSKKYVFLHFLGETSWNSSKIAFSTFAEHPLWHFIYQKCFKSLLKSSKKHYYLPNSILTFPTPLYTLLWSNMVNLSLKTSFLHSRQTCVEYSTGVEYSGGLKKFFVIRSNRNIFPSQRVWSYLFNFLRNPNSIPPLFTPKRGG